MLCMLSLLSNLKQCNIYHHPGIMLPITAEIMDFQKPHLYCNSVNSEGHEQSWASYVRYLGIYIYDMVQKEKVNF